MCSASVSTNGMLCASCWANFDWISDPKCCICGYPFPANLDLGSRPMCPICAADKNELDWMRAACIYDDASKNVMLPFKHASALKYRDLMSRAMIASLRELDTEIDVIMPVPLSWRRLFKRGYNQAALLARPIARHLHAPIDTASVRRKHRPDMGHKNYRARVDNIRGVFTVSRPGNIRGKTILLVDDVMTTGATFSELRRTLKKSGAKAVYGIVFCRVVKAI
ncbi:MAG: ComF family protein [Alphaproteobacteria bacterium]|nr:ComF family protein [Alphaproteobacteria bacterium]